MKTEITPSVAGGPDRFSVSSPCLYHNHQSEKRKKPPNKQKKRKALGGGRPYCSQMENDSFRLSRHHQQSNAQRERKWRLSAESIQTHYRWKVDKKETIWKDQRHAKYHHHHHHANKDEREDFKEMWERWKRERRESSLQPRQLVSLLTARQWRAVRLGRHRLK